MMEDKMPVKEWFRKQPMQLYVVLILTTAFFITELIMSHITHALTLLMDSYHTLCNIMALIACMITLKKGRDVPSPEVQPEANSATESPRRSPSECNDEKKKALVRARRSHQERKLKNTFGWARIEVIGMLICCVFLASLCFSILVEALQTLTHIDHLDEMHHSVSVLCLGATGLLLHGICYLLIGGYTFHQGSFLYVTESGCVLLDGAVNNDSVRKGERRLSRTRSVSSPQYRQRQGCWEMCRDVIGCVFVIICSITVYFTDKEVAKYVDPILSIVSASMLMILSYPYMKESCLILLQTIPHSVDIDILQKQLLMHFPDIKNVHDLHVWQLTAHKVVSTAHIIFQNPTVYAQIVSKLLDFFAEQGITQVTIQPEFYSKIEERSPTSKFSPCLMQCQNEECKMSFCCPNVDDHSQELRMRSKWKSAKNFEDDSPVDLINVVISPESKIRCASCPDISTEFEKSARMEQSEGFSQDNNMTCPVEDQMDVIKAVNDKTRLEINSK